MTRTIDLDDESARQAHAVLAGETCALAELLERSRSGIKRQGGVTWRIPVTGQTVHCLESVYRLATDNDIDVAFAPTAELSPAERAFYDDFARFRLSTGAAARATLLVRELAAAGGELLSAMAGFRPGAPPAALPSKIEAALIIGAYGGDHIGDAAILGGVALGLHRTYGLKRATVLSGRPEHTRRLLEQLSLPVRVEVAEYRAAVVNTLMRQAGALVLGGGPLFDSPRMLARHFAAVSTAQRLGRPFLVDRIGVGWIRRPLSRWAARTILSAASEVSVRSSASARSALLRGVSADVREDPAFDYLRGRSLSPSAAVVRALEQFLPEHDRTLNIGINLRPTGDDWLSNRGARVQSVSPSFVKEFAQALVRFSDRCQRPVRFVFYPMNALQLGMSDLSAAYELQRCLAGAVDLRVWETDPTVDGVAALLDRVDAAVTMRFHGAVFGLARKKPMIGLDYFPGPGGKVSQLFSDLSCSEDASTVASFDGDWLVRRLQTKTSDLRQAKFTEPS